MRGSARLNYRLLLLRDNMISKEEATKILEGLLTRELAKIIDTSDKSSVHLTESAMGDLAGNMPTLMLLAANEIANLRIEIAEYTSAICFETGCVNCAKTLDRMLALEAAMAKIEDSQTTVTTAATQLVPKLIVPAGLIQRCPSCGSGAVAWCDISVRPHCTECGFWGAYNAGTEEDAIRRWNASIPDIYEGAPDGTRDK